MTRSTLTRLVAIATAGVLLVSGAAGCSDDDASADSSGTSIRLGFSAWPGWFPWQVAQEQGLFARNGVKVDLTYFDSYTDSLNALATGNLDANSQTLNDTLSSVSGGAQQSIVLVNDNSTGNDQIIARDGIASVADLKGKKVAAEQGTVDHYLLLLALQKVGLSQKDIQFQALTTDAAAAAFVAGQVDAVGAFAPFTSTALTRPGSRAISTSKDFPGAIPDTLTFDATFVKKHPDLVQALVKTWFATLAWIRDNRAEAVKIMAKRGGVSEEEYTSYDAGTTIFTRDQNLAAFATGNTPANLNFQANAIADFLVSSGLVDKKPSLVGLLEPTFVQAASG